MKEEKKVEWKEEKKASLIEFPELFESETKDNKPVPETGSNPGWANFTLAQASPSTDLSSLSLTVTPEPSPPQAGVRHPDSSTKIVKSNPVLSPPLVPIHDPFSELAVVPNAQMQMPGPALARGPPFMTAMVQHIAMVNDPDLYM